MVFFSNNFVVLLRIVGRVCLLCHFNFPPLLEHLLTLMFQEKDCSEYHLFPILVQLLSAKVNKGESLVSSIFEMEWWFGAFQMRSF